MDEFKDAKVVYIPQSQPIVKKDWLDYTIDIAIIGATLACTIVFVYQAIMYHKLR